MLLWADQQEQELSGQNEHHLFPHEQEHHLGISGRDSEGGGTEEISRVNMKN